MKIKLTNTYSFKGNLEKFIVPFFLWLVSVSTVYSQGENEDALYYENMHSYYKNLVELDSNNLKKMLRAEVKVLSKLDENGSMFTYNRAMSSACTNVCSSPDLANWQYVGPTVIEEGNVQWNGFVEEVSVDPTMVNAPNPTLNCLMGTPTGGIWKYDGTKWQNKTDALGEYGLGITEILRNPLNSSTLLASTGISHTGDYGNSLGLLQSTDNGDSWSGFGPMFPGFDPCKTTIRGVYQNYDNLGNALDLNLHFFVIASDHGQPDQLWEWCAPGWINNTPDQYTQMRTIPSNSYGYYNPHLKLIDFTASENSTWTLTTLSPYSNDGAYLFHGSGGGGCSASVTWIDNSSSIPGYASNMNQQLEVSDSKNNVIFARCKGNNNNTLYRSIDGGLNWTIRTNSIRGGTKLDMEYSPSTGLVYLGETYMMVWDDTNMILHQANSSSQHADTRDFSLLGINAAGQELCIVANDGGVSSVTYKPSLASPDINASGVFVHQPISGTSMAIQQVWGFGVTQSINPDLAIGNMHNNDMALVGGTWCRFGAGDGADIEINQVDNSTVYYSVNPSIYKKDLNNICGTFPFGTFVGNTNQWQFSYPLELHPADQCKLYYGNNAGGTNPTAAELVIYNDCNTAPSQAKSLTNVIGNTSGDYMTRIGAIGISESKPDVIYLGSNTAKGPYKSGLFIKSTDGGDNWIDMSNSPMVFGGVTKAMNDWMGWTNIGDIIVSPTDENLVAVTFQGTQKEFRVALSFDGGASFFDYSHGLPHLPANAILYQNNTEDRFFLGTDAGVYYRDNTMSQWECFTENLPLTWVTDLDINYCENMLYVSTHGRGIYNTSLNVFPSGKRKLEISGNETWTGVGRVIYSDIVVKSGATLNIDHSTIKLAEDVKILVEPSAYLQITGSTLTSLCEGTCWNGIVVEGDSNKPQVFPAGGDQGHAYILNSTISNAKSALNANGDDGLGGVAWDENGGIIRANKSTFINNRRAVSFLYYENITGSVEQANLSNFIDCDFIIDDNYNPSCGSNEAMVTMYHVNGVEFNGCHFIDSRTGLTNLTDFRAGIFGTESTFIVQPSIFTNDKSTFTNLREGIRAENVQDNNIFECQILDTEFYNNQTSIAFRRINNESKILKNHAIIGHPTGADSYGIVLHNSSGFQVEENICEKDKVSYSGWTHGYDIYNTFNANNGGFSTPFAHNVIENNISKDNNVGFKAWGDNVVSYSDGLEFLCNQNIDNTNSDFWILDPIKLFQGSISSPAGNTFTCGSVLPFDIAFTGSCFTYIQETSVPCAFDPCITVQTTSNPSGCNYISYNSISTDVEEELSISQEVMLYPNPTVDNITLSFISKQLSNTGKVEIVDSNGKRVKSIIIDNIKNGINDVLINTEELNEGLYFIILKVDKNIMTKKFIKLMK